MAVTVKYDKNKKTWRWRARATIHGKQKERTGTSEKKGVAQERGNKAYSDLIKLETANVDYDSNVTIGESILEWFNEYKKNLLSESSSAIYNGHIKNHIIPQLGSIKLLKLNRITYQKFINSLVAKDYAKKTIQLINTIMINYLNFMINDMRMIDYNVASKIAIKTKKIHENDADMYYTDEQLRLLFEFSHKLAKTKKQHLYADIFEVLTFTGLRVNELLGLQEEDYDSSKNILKINKQLSNIKAVSQPKLVDLKTKESYREIIINERVKDILKRRLHENKKMRLRVPQHLLKHNFLFGSDGTAIYAVYLREYLKQVCIASGVEYHKKHAIHGFRHTHVKQLIESGVPEVSIQKRIGHAKSSNVTRRYTHSDDKMNIMAVEKYDKLISERF